MAFSEYIRNLLLYNGKVTLPGLGSLEVVKESARVKGKKILPPGSNIIFNPDISIDDGKLSHSLASAEETDIEEARQRVLELVDAILFKLNKGEAFVFEGTGKLFKDENNVLHFEKDPEFILDFDFFGLESFELEPIDEDTVPDEMVQADVSQQEVRTTAEQPVVDPVQDMQTVSETGPGYPAVKKRSSKKILGYVAGLLGIILIGLIILSLTTGFPKISSLKFLNISKDIQHDADTYTKDRETKDDLEKAMDALKEKESDIIPAHMEPVPVKKYEAGSVTHKEYHIIAGSFRDTLNAQELARELTLEGYPVVVIEQSNNLYRVSAMSFNDKETGMKELARFRAMTKNNAAWLLGLD